MNVPSEIQGGHRPAQRATRRAPASRALGRALEVLWIALLALPGAALLPASFRWDRYDCALALVPLWLAIASRLMWPGRRFFLASFPIFILGITCVAAPLLRGVDILDLALQWRTYTSQDVETELRPYAVPLLLTCAGLLALCLCAERLAPSHSPSRRLQIGVAAVTLLAATAVPLRAWPQVWPAKPALVVVAASFSTHRLARWLYPEAAVGSPRDPDASWKGSRMPHAPASEDVVLMIGETVRADYLAECGGPSRVRHVAGSALVACDVTSGTDQTASSVPLLVSREMPGHPVRVSWDSTFQRALKEASYETHWYSVQNSAVAFPDSDDQQFAEHLTRDAPYLLPRLATALRRPAPLKAIVLHAYNAHAPYCQRFTLTEAPYRVDCPAVSRIRDDARIAEVRLAYADAVDASVELVNDVISQLNARPEPAFFIFAPDHAEGLLDDARAIFGHARREATRWDVHVPVVFWANDAWRSTHPAKWANLVAQVRKPLMHADVVPTLLDAADVTYEDPRPARVDLLVQSVPARVRLIQNAPGETVAWSTLVAEARAAGPLAPSR